MGTGMKTLLALAALTAGCADRPAGAVEAARETRERATMHETTDTGEGVSGLPSSFGRSFATLDEYLAHLEQYAGPVDQPWYREVGPGVYELVTTMRPAPEPQTFTREQLMRQFGFTR
jgi:hypothetical protein